MKTYLNFLNTILERGVEKADRTGTGTISLFGYDMRFDLRQGFPLVTTKKLHIKSIVYELLWYLRGDTNINYLNEHGVRIWNPWADESGDLGPVYGRQWRAWEAADGRVIDQIDHLVKEIRTNPHSRRLIVSAWNVGMLDKMALPPCHLLFQFYVAGGRLSCKLTQRSADAFIGVPFNIACYSLLTHMLAEQCDLDVGEFIWSGGDCHIYTNHIEQVKLQLSRSPYPLPKLLITRKPKDISSYAFDDFVFSDYTYHPVIKAPIAV